MIAVHMMEVTTYQIVGMVAVRNRLVSTVGPVLVALLVSSAIVVRSTRRRVLPAYADLMLVDMVAVHVMQVPIVKIVLMTLVLHDSMSTVRTVHVRVLVVYLMIAQFQSPCFELAGWRTAGTSLAWARALKTRSITCWSASP